MTISQRHRNAKVNAQIVIAIRQEYAQGATQPSLARKYGIGPAQVGKIVRGEAWTDVTGGEPIVTDSEAQLRGLQLSTPQGQEFIKTAAQLSFERLIRMAPDLIKPQSAVATAPPTQRSYAEMMAQAEMRADAQDGTQLAIEHAAARMEKSLASPARDSQAAGKTIDAEKLLETLKDEHANTSTIVPPATSE